MSSALDDLLPATEGQGRRFVAVLLALAAAALMLQGGFNLAVDPYGFYGSPLDIERTLTVRGVKLRLMKRAPAPEGLILGSSRVRMLDPAVAGERFGVPFFHAGGPAGGVADWLTFTRHATLDLGLPIRLLIVGIDPPSFTSQPSHWLHPVSYPELRPHLRHPWLTWVRSRVHLVSPDQTELSLKRLAADGEQVRRSRERFASGWRSDGFRQLNPPLDAEQIFQGNLELHRSHQEIEREHLADFQALADFAAERGVTVVTFLTPEAPRLRRALKNTLYPAARETTEGILRSVRDRGVLYCDVDVLRLTAKDFVDPHHLGYAGGKRILRILEICARTRGWREEDRVVSPFSKGGESEPGGYVNPPSAVGTGAQELH